jgi:hypothetical protein
VDLLNRLMIQKSYNTSGKPEQSEEEMNRLVEELTEVDGFITIFLHLFENTNMLVCGAIYFGLFLLRTYLFLSIASSR